MVVKCILSLIHKPSIISNYTPYKECKLLFPYLTEYFLIIDPISQTITLSGFCLQLLPYQDDIIHRIIFL